MDSGVASAHELLAGSIIAAEAIGTGILDGQDEHGHGTLVASLLLHGDVERAVADGLPLQPSCQIVSARVLDAENSFPDADLWEEDLRKAIEWCAAQGAKVINLSIADLRSPYVAPRQMSAAAVVDELARRLDLVIVAVTGNASPVDYLPKLDAAEFDLYPQSLWAHERTTILDPGTSMLALTVGGVTVARAAGGQSGRDTPSRRPMGKPNWPSPVTRTGPGLGLSIKPELVENAGTLGIEGDRLASNDAELGVIGARAEAGRLLAWSIGTSYAAPLVSRIAASIRGRFPDFSAELVRALVLLSSSRVPFSDELAGVESERRQAEYDMVGYGRPSHDRATGSTSHRAVLVAENMVSRDGVHVYEITLPTTFFESGGERGIDVSLSYSPPTRVRRLDYAASRMEFHIVRGMSVDEIRGVFAKLEGADVEDADVSDVGLIADGVDDSGSTVSNDQTGELKPPTLSKLGWKHVALTPSTTVRSRGANQLGRKVFHQRLDEDKHSPIHLVVRNVNRWGDPDGHERYAVAVALWRDEHKPELHAELAAELEAVVEVEAEIEVELEI